MNTEEIVIEQLDFPENVRTRPGMYIGSTENSDVLLREIIDNSVDEIYSSKSPCDTIRVDDTKKLYVIQDNGRGIPITPALNNKNITMALQAINSLHAGSKFHKVEIAGGQNGVGGSCVQALSEEYNLFLKLTESKLSNTTEEVTRLFIKSNIPLGEAYLWIHCEHGYHKYTKVVSLKEVNDYLEMDIDENSMTIVAFEPDHDIMLTRRAILPQTLKYVKYINRYIGNKDVKFFYNGNQYTEFFEPYKYDSIVKIKSENYDPKNPEATFLFSFDFLEEFGSTTNTGSVNGLIVNQGWHINYTQECFKRAFNLIFPGDYHGNEIKGLKFSTIILCPEPAFSSQTKERLTGVPGITLNYSGPLISAIARIFTKNKDAFELHKNKVMEYNASTKNISKINLIRTKVPIVGIDGERRAAMMKPVSVRDCTSKNRSECSLYLCEGRSAAGSLMQARDPKIHAIMGLRGKPLNATGLDIDTILENPEIKDIISAIGTGVDDLFSLKKVNYSKIIIVADGDPDGGNIASLLLGLFYGHMKYLIKEGMVYICESPLFVQNGNFIYASDVSKLDKSKPFSRIKGLGELNPDEMKKIAFDIGQRRLIRVTEDGIGEAIRLITTTYARRQLLTMSGIINDGNKLTSKEIFGV